MGLSFRTVQKTYEIFHELREEFGHPRLIPSWPADMAEWDDKKKKDPPTSEVTGYGKKQDDGWEELFFFVENPSKEMIAAFDLKCETYQIGHTRFNEKYDRNTDLWLFGWF